MKNYSVEKLADLPYYTEGPAVNTEGILFFTSLGGSIIYSFARKTGLQQWGHAKCPNGQVILPDHTHLLCDSVESGIAVIDSTGKFQKWMMKDQCAGYRVQTPNDLITDRHGNLYFTDSVRQSGKVFFIGKNGDEKLVADQIDYANGLALSPREDTLYVAESYQNRILSVHLTGAGYSSHTTVFSPLPQHPSGVGTQNLPDGLATDQQGRIWVAHYGMQAIQVVSDEGERLFSLDTTLPLTSNLCFINEEPTRKVILVTGGSGEPGPGAVVKITVNF